MRFIIGISGITICFIFFTGCAHRFLRDPKEAAPNYARSKFWTALPQKKDSADFAVKGLRDEQSSAAVDVFFVHPTTYIVGNHANANVEDSAIISQTDRFPTKYQASVFNGSCRIYAPRYREVEFLEYLAPKPEKKKAFEVAYSDVRRAFLYYLKHYNHGRPFIIASHSQGSDHAIRLCREFLDRDSALNRQFVAAYLVGGLIHKDTFTGLCPCDSASQTGCFVTWNSVRWGELTFYGKPVVELICVNPLTWKRNHDQAPASLNKGSVPIGFSRIDEGLADAKCGITGMLWVHKPKVDAKDYPQINSPFYHILDYNLFYVNIRENVKVRIDAYFRLRHREDPEQQHALK
ncbi:MAG: DUF3089 domain-containing protein [Bacteroidia bacterium]